MVLIQNSFLLGKPVFVLRPQLIRMNLLFTILKGTFIQILLIGHVQKHLYSNNKTSVRAKTGHHRLTNLANKINHHVHFACRFIFSLIVSIFLHVDLNNIEI